MGASRLLEVALRVFGLWVVFHSMNGLAAAATMYLSSRAMAPVFYPAYYVAIPVVTSMLVQSLLGGVLIYWAPNIAARFYPPGSEGGELQISVGPGDVYRTACFILGAYLLVQTAGPAGRLAIFGFQGNARPDQLAADAITATVYLASGLLLVFGSRKIAELLSNLRYDPDTIPNQQFSIAMLLIVLALVAVVMGVARRLASDN